MKRILPITGLLLAALFLSTCANQKRDRGLEETLRQYESMIRWSQWDGAVAFLSPDYLENNPISRLDMDRLGLYRVTRYQVRAAVPYDGGNALRQTVQIGLFNRNRAIERVILDQQDWRYDPETERWLLHSGLPDVTRRR